MNWQVKSFEQLSALELYDFLKLRSDIFVVEQDCVYSDLDGLDKDSGVLHLFAYQDGSLVAYCRLLAPNIVYTEFSAIGRVVVDPSVRGQKLGERLMQQALKVIDETWPEVSCKISAQAHLQKFYGSLGFKTVGKEYLEDGIPHVGMLRGVTPA
jgi:ElaA protein